MVTAASTDEGTVAGRIPDGPMLDRLIGEAMGTPELDFSLRTRFAARGIYAVTATLCLAAAFALVRRYR
ncbi:hypothetical protein ACIBEK_04505 [Nocardia fusca]|uniref:hypothetical protein n=1 Tax=Nocardia fusca TaxID=941183 RepID=UPI003797753B